MMAMIDQETLVWYSADAPPDDDTMVLVYAPSDDVWPVWVGYYDEGCKSWFQADGSEYDNPNGLKGVEVKAWAPMPAGCEAACDLDAA